MAETFLVPQVTQVETPLQDRKIYEVAINPTLKINVTVTDRPDVLAQWITLFNPEHHSFVPAGVVVHTAGDRVGALTLSIGQECLVFQLPWSLPPSRDVLVFLRDVCTCFGWRTDAYGDLLRAKYATLSLGRLTDIRSFIPNGYNKGLGDFSAMIFGCRVHEPAVHSWKKRGLLKKNQLRETAMEAYICQKIGLRNPDAAPPNNSLSRVISYEFPYIIRTEDMADRTMYQVSINNDESLLVTYTNKTSVLTSWLTRIVRRGRQVGLIGIDVNHDHRASTTAMALAFEKECLVYNVYHAQGGCLVSDAVFNVFLDSNCPFVGWNPGNVRDVEEELGLRPERVLNVRDEFPFTHTYEDLSRLVLGYETTKLNMYNRQPDEEDIMTVSVQAYTCLLGGKHFGYENRDWTNE